MVMMMIIINMIIMIMITAIVWSNVRVGANMFKRY
jgi:hypothetical protein